MLNTIPDNVKEIMNELSQRIIVIEHYTETSKSYKKLIEKYYDYIKQGFEHEEFRTCPVYFKFFDNDESQIHTMQLRHFVTSLMMWEPMVRMNVYDFIDDSYIVDMSKLSGSMIKSYIDNKIIIPFRKDIENTKMNNVIHSMMYNLSRISTDFNVILGMSINIETFIDIANKNPRFDEILHTKLDDSLQPHEIEDYLMELTHEQLSILGEEDNPLRPIVRSGTGIKDGQFKEFAVNAGLAPDLDGTTIPIPINTNFIVGGLSNVTNYYIDAKKGRMAAIMNKTQMGKSGHFSRMVMLLCSDVILRKDAEDCMTKHPIRIKIRTHRHLQKLIGRNYRLEGVREYSNMTGNETHLIGQYILLRSPITCASKHICKTCYGNLYYTNVNIHSVGGFAGTAITNPLSQSVLSAKHLLTTKSVPVEFESDFFEFFSVNANEILINMKGPHDISNYSLLIIKDNVIDLDDFAETDNSDSDSALNRYTSYVEVFHIKNKKTGEILNFTEGKNSEMYITPELSKLMTKPKKGVYEIDLTKFNVDDRVFAIEIANNELTKPLYDMMNLMDSNAHNGATTIDEMGQMMLDLIIESGMKTDSIHGETIMRPLIRSDKDIIARPNFRKYGDDAGYQILTVTSALKNHPAPLISLAFQDLLRQLTNPLTFRKKESSFVDPFYRGVAKK